MKKTNSLNSTFFLIVVFLLLVVMGSIGATVAYFTAQSSKSGDINFHDVTLTLNSTNGDDIFSSDLTAVMPGQILSFDNLTVVNDGSADVYVILQLKLTFTKNDTPLKTVNKWFNLNYQEINTEDLMQNETGASELETGNYQTLSLDYELVGSDFDNDYKGASIQVSVSAYCIQKENLPEIDGLESEALVATYMLVTDYNV